MMHSLLMQWHPMVGCDMHDAIFPPAPATVPAQPHVVAATLRWLLPLAKTNDTVLSTMASGKAMSKGTDISNFIPHIPFGPDVLAIIDTASSGSKSEFGASTVVLHQGPAAAALIGALNLNLNCNGATVPPWLNGFVIAPSSVNVGLTWGDIIAGFVTAVVDSAIQFASNKIFGKMFPTEGMGVMGAFMTNAVATAAQTFSPVAGTPEGYSPGYTLVGGLVGGLTGAFGTAIQQGIDNGGGAGLSAGAEGAKEAWNQYPPVKAVKGFFDSPATPVYPATQPAGP